MREKGRNSHISSSSFYNLRRVGLIRTVLIFSLLTFLKYLSKVFYRHDFVFLGQTPRDPWKDLRLVVFLNHTSLFEPVFLGGVPNSFIWRLAAHGVVPAADKTTGRFFVGMIFKFVAHHVIPITRERDHTWFEVLQKIDPKSMVVIAPEGRMKRANGLDINGNPMSVRGGIADILLAVKEGRMLLAYSGGLHHVQVPGRPPRIFKTVRLRIENLEVSDYIAGMTAKAEADGFKKAVMKDLDARRDAHAPEEGPLAKTA